MNNTICNNQLTLYNGYLNKVRFYNDGLTLTESSNHANVEVWPIRWLTLRFKPWFKVDYYCKTEPKWYLTFVTVATHFIWLSNLFAYTYSTYARWKHSHTNFPPNVESYSRCVMRNDCGESARNGKQKAQLPKVPDQREFPCIYLFYCHVHTLVLRLPNRVP